MSFCSRVFENRSPDRVDTSASSCSLGTRRSPPTSILPTSKGSPSSMDMVMKMYRLSGESSMAGLPNFTKM